MTAAIFAGWAAHWAKQQAGAAAEQTKTAGEQLQFTREGAAAAQQQPGRQLEEATRLKRRQLEGRSDVIAPIVIATARRQQLTMATRAVFESVTHRQELAISRPEQDAFPPPQMTHSCVSLR